MQFLILTHYNCFFTLCAVAFKLRGYQKANLNCHFQSQQQEKLEQEFSIWECSSLIWVCSSNERRSFVTILDANNPNNIIECFNVGEAHLLSVASVAGVRESDYPAEDKDGKEYLRNGGYVKNLPPDVGDHEAFGEITWVDLRRSDVDDIPTYCSINEKSSPRRERNFSVSKTDTEVAEEADEIGELGFLYPSLIAVDNNHVLQKFKIICRYFFKNFFSKK